jgi:hypothetical protein
MPVSLRLSDLWRVQELRGSLLLEDPKLVRAMTPACAAEKWATFHQVQLRHVSQRHLSDSDPESKVLFEALVLNAELPGERRIQIFEVEVIS